MNNTLITTTFLIGLLFGSCGNKPAENSVDVSPIENKTTVTTEILVQKIIDTRHQTIERLKTLKPEEANLLYKSYKKENDSLVLEIEKLEYNILDIYVTFYGQDGQSLQLPDSVKLKEQLLNKAYLQFWEVGEGMTEIRTKHDFYLKIFKNYVTPDYQDFITIKANEDEYLYAADAGLSISFHDLGKRVIAWENFIAQYQGSTLMPEAIETYEYYQWDYLLGLDNTPTIEHSTGEIYPENKTEFEQFIKENPKSFTSTLVKIVLNNRDSYDNLITRLKDERAGYIY